MTTKTASHEADTDTTTTTTAVASANVYDLSYTDDRQSRQLLLIGYDKQHAIDAALTHLRLISGARGYAKRTRSGWVLRNDPDVPKGSVRSLLLVHGTEGLTSTAGTTQRHAVLRERRAAGIRTGRRFVARFATDPGQNIFFPEETDGNPAGLLLVEFDDQKSRRAKHLEPQPKIHIIDKIGE